MKKLLALLILTLAVPVMAANILYDCVAVKATAWIPFVNSYLGDFNNGRGNAPDFDSLKYVTKTNSSGVVFNCFAFNQGYMQHGSNMWDGAYMTGMANAFNNPSGRMIAAGDVTSASQWFIDNGLFDNSESGGAL